MLLKKLLVTMLHTYYEHKYNHNGHLISKTFYKTALIIKNEDLVNGEIPPALLQRDDDKYTSLDVRNTNIKKIPKIDHIIELIACNCKKLNELNELKNCTLLELGGCISLEKIDLTKFPKLEHISVYGSSIRSIDGKIKNVIHYDGNVSGTHSKYYKLY